MICKKKRYLFSKLITLVIIPWYVIKNVTKLEKSCYSVNKEESNVQNSYITLHTYTKADIQCEGIKVFFPAIYLLEEFVLLFFDRQTPTHSTNILYRFK